MKEAPTWYKLKQSLHLRASVLLGTTQGKQTRQNIPRMFRLGIAASFGELSRAGMANPFRLQNQL